MEKTPTLCQQEGKASVGGPKVFKMVTRKALKNSECYFVRLCTGVKKSLGIIVNSTGNKV